MNIFEAMAERRIAEGRLAGLFDDLPGAGKPIPDLGIERAPGWWATRVARRERSKMRGEQLDDELAAGRAGLWHLESEDEVRRRAAELNLRIERYNRTTTWEPRSLLDVELIVRQRRRLGSGGC